jgi:hypothetical protein
VSSASQERAAASYRLVAKVFAAMLATSSVVQSVVLHRSGGSGEVVFARSDVDLLVILNEHQAEDGAKVASFYRTVERAPFQSCVEPH